jgi:hypothetical protein
MALYRNIAGIPNRLGRLYNDGMEMERADENGGGGGGGFMYPEVSEPVLSPANPIGAGVDIVTLEQPVPEPIPGAPPVEMPGQTQESNTAEIKEPAPDWLGLLAAAGIVFAVAVDNRPVLLGSCALLLLRMGRVNVETEPVSILPVMR